MLKKVGLKINPYDWQQSGIYANLVVYKNEGDGTKPIITLGEDNNIFGNPGVAITPAPAVKFNVTKSENFDYSYSIFDIHFRANKIIATADQFKLVLSGKAGIAYGGIEGSLGYSGFTVTQDGITDYGNLTESGTLTLQGFATLDVGQFVYKKFDTPQTISVAQMASGAPEAPQGGQPSVPAETKEVTELLCFGPCPVDSLGGTDSDALHLSINAGTDSDKGGISGGVHSIFYYKTSGGEQRLDITQAHIEISDNFVVSASLAYMDSDQGYSLRAAATGKFNFGGVEVGALVAGKFAEIDGKTSYGLFVAVQSSAGIPIVPGIVTLTGAGGGFFYNPTPDDLEMVRTAVSNFGHEIVDKTNFGTAGNLKFAVLLYGAVSVAGQGSASVMSGSTYLQVTNQSMYIDARANILGLDGDGFANAKLGGSMSLFVQYDPTFVNGTVSVDLKVPYILTGSGDIEYFAKNVGGSVLWGIIGEAQFDVLNAFSGGGEFLAGNDGVMLTVSLGFDVGIPLISVSSDLTGSVWVLNAARRYDIPIGAYVVFKAEACLGICISAEAKGAVAYKDPGFALYAAVKGCVDLMVTTECLSAWASFEKGKLDAGFGSSGHGDLIAQAQQQRDEFKERLEQMKNKLAALGASAFAPPTFSGFAYDAEDVRLAGLHFYEQPLSVRRNFYIGGVYWSPTAFSGLYTNVLFAPRQYKNYYGNEEIQSLRSEIESNINTLEQVTEAFIPRFDEGIQMSEETVENAQNAMDNLLQSMATSPVSNVTHKEDININPNMTETVSFDYDDGLAQDQVGNITQTRQAIQQLDLAFRDNIAAVDSSLHQMHDFFNVWDDLYKRIYANTYSNIKEYYALEVNMAWQEDAWARRLRGNLQAQKSTIDNWINDWKGSLSDQIDNYLHVSGVAHHYPTVARDLAKQNNAMLLLADSTFDPNEIGNLKSEVEDVRDNLLDKEVLENDKAGVIAKSVKIQEDFWYNMNNEGLDAYSSVLADRVQSIYEVDEQFTDAFLEPYRQVTQLYNQIYTNQAHLTAILYNMITNYLYFKGTTKTIPTGTGSAGSNSSGNTGSNTTGGGLSLVPMSPQYILVTEYEPINTDVLRFFAPSPYKTRLKELSKALMPPQITAIKVDPNRPNDGGVFGAYYNKATVSWSAVHPMGVTESSIDVITGFRRDIDITTGYDNYVTIGTLDNITLYPYRTNIGGTAERDTKQLSIGVRVRGYAGNTATRRATVLLDVGPKGPKGSASVSSSGGDILDEDTTPPGNVSIKFYAYDKTSIPQPSDGPLTFDPGPLITNPNFWGGGSHSTGPDYIRRYWTNNATVIKFKVYARDTESSIQNYEYAVGSTIGGTDVVDWATLQGMRGFDASVGSSTLTGQTRFINMTPGNSYYVSVHVTNNAGLSSRIAKAYVPVVYDSEAPTMPGEQLGQQMMLYTPPVQIIGTRAEVISPVMVMNITPPVDEAVENIPYQPYVVRDYEDNLQNTAYRYPRASFEWESSDDALSGVKGYQYVITQSETLSGSGFTDAKFMLFDGSRNISLTHTYFDEIAKSENPYLVSYYLHVRAIDYAGNASEEVVKGPINPYDVTAPEYGRMTAEAYADKVMLYYSSLPIDKETGVKGVQYSIGLQPGSTEFKNWPGGDDVDFESFFHPDGSPKQYILSGSELPEDGIYYINYRFVNNEGVKSSPRSILVYIDHTKPLEANIEMTYNEDEEDLEIQILNLGDPETGISKLSYEMVDYQGASLQGAHPTTGSTSWKNTRKGIRGLTLHETLKYEDIPLGRQPYLMVYIENGAGLYRLVTVKMPVTPRTLTEDDIIIDVGLPDHIDLGGGLDLIGLPGGPPPAGFPTYPPR